MFFPVRYETNDDFTNVMRLSSQSRFEPEASSPVLSQTLVKGLVALYQWAPQVPWYGLVVYLALSVGIFLISSVFIRQYNLAGMLICFPAAALFFFHGFTLVSYTTAALLLELGVLVSLLEWVIIEKCPYHNRLGYAGFLCFGFTLSYMLRWELVLFAVAFGFPILLYSKRYQLIKAGPWAFALIAFIAADRVLFHHTAGDADKVYMTYNELRRVFHDTEKGRYHEELTPVALEKTGWDVQDYITYKKWVLYDDKMFNAGTLQTFLTENDPQRTLSILKIIPRRLKVSLEKSKNVTIVLFCALIALFVSSAFDLMKINRTAFIRLAVAFGVLSSMILYFAYYRFEARVYIPLYAYFLTVTFLILQSNRQPERKKNKLVAPKAIVYVCLVLLAATACKSAYAHALYLNRKLNISVREKHYIVNCLKEVKKRTSGTDSILILMNPTDSLGTQSVHPLKESADYSDICFMPATTGVNSPRYQTFLKALNLSSGHEFLQWTIDNKRILFAFIVRSQKHHQKYLSMWETYYNRRVNPGKRTRLKPVLDFREKAGTGLVFYNMVSQ